MRYRKQKCDNKKIRVFCIIVAILLVFLFLIDLRIRPLIKKVCSYQCEIIATSIITNTVYSVLQSEGAEYNNLVVLTRNIDGNVTSVENNMLVINKIHSNITNSINDEYDKISMRTIMIPIGSLSDVDYFHGRGPDLVFKLDPVGSVRTSVVSRFTSVGVNQSLHEIILEVECDISAVIPGYTNTVNVKTQYIIASTIIVGNIPDSFTYITGDGRDDISKIMDYKN